MKLRVSPSTLSGEMRVPPSKSQTVRAILFASRAQGESEIIRPLFSDDTYLLLAALKELGISWRQEGESLIISGGTFKEPKSSLYLGNSGIGMRFLLSFLALDGISATLAGDESLSSRSMDDLISGLSLLGVLLKSSAGFPPITLSGKLKAGKTQIRGRESQAVSSLLMAASFAKGKTEIVVTDPGETAWVELTLSWLKRFQLPFQQDGYRRFILPGGGKILPFTYEVPGDFSTALFPLAAALMTRGTVTVKGLDFDDPQGDKALLFLLKEKGADIELFEDGFRVDGRGEFLGGEWPLGEMIDALPVAAVLATRAKERVTLTDLSLARIKECDRVLAMKSSLSMMGAEVEEIEDRLIITPSTLRGASLKSFSDHRIAMALAVGALGATSPSSIDHFSVHEKTFPDFVLEFLRAGAAFS